VTFTFCKKGYQDLLLHIAQCSKHIGTLKNDIHIYVLQESMNSENFVTGCSMSKIMWNIETKKLVESEPVILTTSILSIGILQINPIETSLRQAQISYENLEEFSFQGYYYLISRCHLSLIIWTTTNLQSMQNAPSIPTQYKNDS
jgi:hypothetical protein